ncbi:restriction endonuclease [Janthinobacterium sp. HH01]|uniref:restriction endonuclease n=1 Tax=Janthinobacterium sp. HH01 TaxID=1198452 RepID=UPI0002AEB8CB|nr:restriction endonuclease [Janthinobacterium sp. HH01]ELX13774.1 restriction endonuclease [Janthinobacterium sp. HH01]
MKTARQHCPSITDPSTVHLDLPWWTWTFEDKDEFKCAYCHSRTDDYYDPDLWDVPFSEFEAAHNSMVKDPEFPGPPPDSPQAQLSGEICERKTCLHICPECGWWVAEDSAVLAAKQWQHWAITLASMSALQDLDLTNIAAPIREVRQYLRRKFNARATMHPRLLELTVASVFSDFGRKVVATAYTNDGGIDAVLEDVAGKRVGIQVKRQKNTVEVEQIRAFLGALVLGGYERGVFVSTSRFSKGAVQAAQQSTEIIMPVSLVDADRFFDILRYAQLTHTPSPTDCHISRTNPLKFHFQEHHHLKTL